VACRGCLTPLVGREAKSGRSRFYCNSTCRRFVSNSPNDFRKLRPTGRRCANEHCGKSINDRDIRAKYCSTRCNYVANGACLPGPLPERRCALPACDAVFQPKYRNQQCCCEKHGKRWCNLRNKDAYNKTSVPCAVCYSPVFVWAGRDKRAKFCSDDCKGKYGKQLVHVGSPAPRCDIPTQHPARTQRYTPKFWWTLVVCGRCAWCSGTFTGLAASASTAPKYCSSRCQKGAGKAKRGRFQIPDTVRRAIYERDHSTCQLCFKLVDLSLDTNDMWGATLDHIECQSWTDDPDHSPGNLRLAHRWCNSKRNDERFVTAAELAA